MHAKKELLMFERGNTTKFITHCSGFRWTINNTNTKLSINNIISFICRNSQTDWSSLPIWWTHNETLARKHIFGAIALTKKISDTLQVTWVWKPTYRCDKLTALIFCSRILFLSTSVIQNYQLCSEYCFTFHASNLSKINQNQERIFFGLKKLWITANLLLIYIYILRDQIL